MKSFIRLTILLSAGFATTHCTSPAGEPGESSDGTQLEASASNNGESEPAAGEEVSRENAGKKVAPGAKEPRPAAQTVAEGEGKGVDLDGGDGGKVKLGRVENEDLRKLLHGALEQRIDKDNQVSDGANEKVELGDLDSFQFTVVKLSHGADDVSGDQSETPDGIEVEVNGWYKRTLTQVGAPEAQISCVSFDTYARAVKHGKLWFVPKDYQISYNREDNEDCY